MFASEESQALADQEKSVEAKAHDTYYYGFRISDLASSILSLQQFTGFLRMSDLLHEGIIFFNAGRYFEAHEAWEDMWRPARGPLRLFYQGLVQAAVAMHHLSTGNMNGATAQLQKSLSKLEQYPNTFCRIDNAKLTADLRQVLAHRGSQQLPHIEIVK